MNLDEIVRLIAVMLIGVCLSLWLVVEQIEDSAIREACAERGGAMIGNAIHARGMKCVAAR